MKPITRKELYLNKIVGNNDYEIPEKPISEEELFFVEILGEVVQAPEPLTRYQMYLAKIAGRNIEIPYPEVRLEYFLAKAAGMDITVPVPITREEIYWSNYTAIVEFEVENVPPLTYKAIEGTLKNYRIYGNTVNGESVGDRTGNLFDENYPRINDRTIYRAIYVGTGFFTLSSDIPIFSDTANLFLLSGNVSSGASSSVNGVGYGVPRSAESIDGYITIVYRNYYGVDPRDYNVMLNSGTNPLPYEPYGYKVPVTVSNGTDTQTTPIYLPEQIKMVGDEAEYIDFGEQKQYFADGTSTDVLLPALPTISGTNTLSVGTEVQPSKVYIKGEKEREYT